MRALIEIPEQQVEQLAQICEHQKVSRTEAIRQAISLYIERNKPDASKAFGLWKDQAIDGLSYQEQVRAEW